MRDGKLAQQLLDNEDRQYGPAPVEKSPQTKNDPWVGQPEWGDQRLKKDIMHNVATMREPSPAARGPQAYEPALWQGVSKNPQDVGIRYE